MTSFAALFVAILGTGIRSQTPIGVRDPAVRIQTAGACLGPDSQSRARILQLDSWVASSDSFNRAFRAQFKLKQIEHGLIVLVADTALCRKGIQALDSLDRRTKQGRRVYLYSIGPQYLVEESEMSDSGGHHWAGFFDTAWRYLSGVWW
jgi:hypothetical protein